MQKTRFKKTLSFAVCLVLVAAIALFITGCNGENTPTENSTAATTAIEAPEASPSEMGQGKTQFNFSITFPDKTQKDFIIKTDKTTVGEALQELGLIDGEKGPYGLYVKKVNGVELDYDTHGKYWAFYIDGEMAMTGVDSTGIEPGVAYSFVAVDA